MLEDLSNSIVASEVCKHTCHSFDAWQAFISAAFDGITHLMDTNQDGFTGFKVTV